MKVILFGATGMVGQGVLRECLLDPDVDAVLAVGRNALIETNPQLRQLTLADMADYATVESELRGYDACLFCLGVSSAGMQEEAYRHITYGITLAAAETLVRLNPAMTFIYVSGSGTDSSEKGRVMWARVKGATENALLKLPFRGCYMFRPGFIQPLHGIRSKTPLYQAIYSLMRPITPMLLKMFPKSITTTEQLGRAMLRVARDGYSKPILETADICSF
jgi:uncharacterized protein YbjT (DUF2867 family)